MSNNESKLHSCWLCLCPRPTARENHQSYLCADRCCQRNSTGPISFATGSPGSYALHFQANINTTNCNILPSVTPIANITLYARTTLHRGQRYSGTLVGGWSLPL